MKKHLFSGFTAFALFLSFESFSQKAQQYWEPLLQNDRANALKAVEQLEAKEESIEHLLAKEIIRFENGRFQTTEGFMAKFNKMSEKDPYLYALWNKSFFFQDYLLYGFNNRNSAVVDASYNLGYKNATISSGLTYLKGVKERTLNNFPGFEKYVGQIKAIRDWQFCGVFENLNNSGVDANYEPETNPRSATDFNANSNGFLNWYKPAKNSEPWMILTNQSEYGSGVHYAQTFVKAPNDQEVYIRVGCSAKFKIWINDVLIFENPKDLTTELDAFIVKIKMPKGMNRLLFKLAEVGEDASFIVRMTDKNGNYLDELVCSSEYADYNKSTTEQLEIEPVKNEFEEFFLKKYNDNKDDFFSAYCLIHTYLRNNKFEEARDILDPWLDAYPSSSVLRILAITVHAQDNNNNLVEEMKENIKQDDPNYHMSLLMVFSDIEQLFRMSQEQMEKILDDYANSVDDKMIFHTTEMIKFIRLDDKKSMKKQLDKLMALSLETGNLNSLKTYASLYKAVLNDATRTQKLYEQMNTKYFDAGVRDQLTRIYDNQGNRAKAKKIMEENVKWMPNEMPFLKEIVYYMHYTEDFKGSIVYIDRMLELFPYSFVAMELKGDALLQTGNTAEAMEWYRKSLIHNSGNSDLRRKIRDINKLKDNIEDYRTKDVYKFISENKGKIKKNNFGYNILLDEVTVELYEEAGGKTRSTYVYEVTSDEGVENLKEYDLGLNGNYSIIKAEIVRGNGKIIPAEKMGSSFVFNGLQVGDLIYIDYQTDFNGYGRFYRDFIDDYQFTSVHPVLLEKYTLLAPKDMAVRHEVKNGKLEFSQKTDEKFNIYQWTLKDHSGMPANEDFMPNSTDIHTILSISTMENWSEIANWYSDLVRQQVEVNSVVKKVFNEIFPNGHEKLSDSEKAKMIYSYLSNNLTYSYVPFKQSGFVPQKPSKTITTKMGDCKDMSTLFVTLADLAGMKSNLVLVSTRDNGKTKLVLPSQSFNHCIVKVEIDGKGQYLELTDKNLPFGALPSMDIFSQILEIPRNYDPSFNYELSYLVEDRRMKNKVENYVKMNVNADNKKLTIETKMTGSIKSYTADIFEGTSYDIIKKRLLDRYQRTVGQNSTLDSVYNIVSERKNPFVSYSVDVTLKEKTNKIGKFNVVKVPVISNIYTAGIVTEETRNYPIDYLSYEDTDEYSTVYDIHIKEGEKFTEIPADTELKFKDHTYSIKYSKISPNHLKVNVVAKPGLMTDISVADYPEFKKFVEKVLQAQEEMIAFE